MLGYSKYHSKYKEILKIYLTEQKNPPVLRGHLWDKEKVKTGDLLKEVQLV
jgi:hypothetical protein